jgi:hypothetical protein
MLGKVMNVSRGKEVNRDVLLGMALRGHSIERGRSKEEALER